MILANAFKHLRNVAMTLDVGKRVHSQNPLRSLRYLMRSNSTSPQVICRFSSVLATKK